MFPKPNSTLIPKALINDPSISPEAKWLVMFLMSYHQDKKQIHVLDLDEIFKGQAVFKKLPKIVDQCKEKGLIKISKNGVIEVLYE